MTTNQARQPEGIPTGGQYAATAHQPGTDLDASAQRHAAVIAALEAVEEARKSRRGALMDRLRSLDAEDALLGASKAALEIRKVYPGARSLSFTRVTNGVTLMKDIRDRQGLPLTSRARHLTQNLPVESEINAAQTFINKVPFHDYAAQGIEPLPGDGTEFQLVLDESLNRTAERLLPGGAAAAEARTADALAIWDEGEGPDKTFRNMFADMNHAATSRGIDPREAFEDSYQMFLTEIYARQPRHEGATP